MNANITIDFLNQLSDKLSGKAEQLFSILVKQNILIGKIDVIIGIGMLFLFIGSVVAIKYFYEKDKKSTGYEAWDLWIALTVVVSVLLFVAFICCSTCGYLKLVNPAYYAILNIISCM